MRSTWVQVVVAVSSMAAGCGDDDGGSTPPDAAPVFDAAPPDAAVPQDFWYVMDSVLVPESVTQAATVALDLDGDDHPDNAIGGLLAAIANQADIPLAQGAMAAVQSGAHLQLVGVTGATLAGDPEVAVITGPGIDQDADAADNFSGSEPFQLDPVATELPASIAAGGLAAGPGAVTVQMALFAFAPPIGLEGSGARVRADIAAGGLTSGSFAVAFSQEQTDIFIGHLAAGFAAIVEADCPKGACEPGSSGETLVEFFDDDGDVQVTEEEVRANSLIQSTIGNPDLDLFDADGDFNPRVDGVKDSLSYAHGFTAVGAVRAD